MVEIADDGHDVMIESDKSKAFKDFSQQKQAMHEIVDPKDCRFNVMFSQDIMLMLKKVSEYSHRSMSGVVRSVMKDYLTEFCDLMNKEANDDYEQAHDE